VAFDLTETRATAQDAAVYATPNDERDFVHRLLELLRRADLRRQMGALARWRVETHLTWPHSVPRLLEAYRAVGQTGLQAQPEPSPVRAAAERG
jgi:glycosyltransferase involved in cell wall biosynthesis